MAKEDRAKIKMTVIHFETESDNSTLVENIKAISQTLTRALSQPPRLVQSFQSTSPEAKQTTEDIIAATDEFDTEPITVNQEVGSNGSKKTTPRPFRTLEVVDIDLTSGDQSLKDFLTKKNPDGDNKRYIAIAYWLKTKRNIAEITADHAYTCYRHMGWQVPSDASRPLRNIKDASHGWMKNGSVRGAYAITHLGENEVGQMG